MGQVEIDGVLLRHLRGCGLEDDLTAALAEGVLRHDAKAKRGIGLLCSGDATFEDEIVMCPVRLAHGIHWCGGQLRLVNKHASIPDTIGAALIGRPLGTVMRHDLLDAEARITAIRHEDTSRFSTGWHSDGDTAVTIIETDEPPVTIRTSLDARMRAAWRRVWEDQVYIARASERLTSIPRVKTQVAMNMAMVAGMAGYWAHNLQYAATLPGAAAAGMGTALLWAAVAVPFMLLRGRDVRDETGFAHLTFRKEMLERQQAEGMRH